jgi:hypothetical protein
MPKLLKNIACGIIIFLNICGCSETFQGPDPIITPQGAVPIEPNSAGLVNLFFNSATISYTNPADSKLAQRMLSDGYALIYSNCSEYFHDAGKTQQTLLFSRDLIGTIGTLGTGIIALAHASKDATAIVALATATSYSIMDNISKDFLFSSNNIDSVRTLTLRALQKDQATVLGKSQNFSYQTSVLYLQDDQNYCSLRKIASLVVDAAKNADVESAAPQKATNLVGSSGGPSPPPLLTPGLAAPAPPPPPAFIGGAQAPATFQPSVIRVKPLYNQ